MPRQPFYIPSALYQLSFTAPKEAVAAVELMFEEAALAVSSFEVQKSPLWRVEILLEAPLPEAEIARRLQLVKEATGVEIAPAHAVKVENKDWVGEVQRAFPPLRVAQFFVYGSHIKEALPLGVIGLEVDAGQAFGTGEHATTSGCLLALSHLAKERRCVNMLDMGTGSGILAMAAAKLWKCKALGVDIDKVSIEVAAENMRKNNVAQYARMQVGDGYNSAFVKRAAPYDVIVSNILARPLMKFAPALAQHLAPGGVAILSGLLSTQETMVLAAHRAQHLTLVKRITKDGWSTLVLKK